MSQNPSLVVGDVASPVSTDMLHEVMAVTAGSGGVVYSAPDLDIPIKAGQTYYIAISAAGSVVVGIDP